MESKESMALTEQQEKGLERFNINEERIAALEKSYLPMKINGISDKVGFAMVHEARMLVRGIRTGIEKVRKELKEDSIRWGKLVDSKAKAYTEKLQPIEDHLEAQEKAVEDEKARLRKEEEDRKAKIVNDRVNALIQYSKEKLNMFAITQMTDKEYEAELARVKGIHDEEVSRKAEMEAMQARVAARIVAFAHYGVKITEDLARGMSAETCEKELKDAALAFEERKRVQAEEEQRQKDTQAAEEKRQEEERKKLAADKEENEKKAAALKEREDALKRQEEEIQKKAEDLKLNATKEAKLASLGAMPVIGNKTYQDIPAQQPATGVVSILVPGYALADLERLNSFASMLEHIVPPVMGSEEGAAIMDRAVQHIEFACRILKREDKRVA